jgi:pimeloyl-ACP methyl ester carboxylesterase
MVTSGPAKARGIPGFLGHPKHVGGRWSEAQAEAVHRLSQLPNFRRSWTTLLRRFLRLSGANPELTISADQLRTVTQPTLFLWGSGDNFGSPDVGRAAVAQMADARLEIVGIGHLPWWDDPQTCARFIRDFATKLESDRRMAAAAS